LLPMFIVGLAAKGLGSTAIAGRHKRGGTRL
jgi:hypothetical protein